MRNKYVYVLLLRGLGRGERKEVWCGEWKGLWVVEGCLGRRSGGVVSGGGGKDLLRGIGRGGRGRFFRLVAELVVSGDKRRTSYICSEYFS